jgi:hypothetical protein
MRSRFVITFALLVISSLMLIACRSEAENTYPGIDEPATSPEGGEAYPYPSNELYLPVTGSNPAYPAPESGGQIEPYPGVLDSYPGIDGSGNSELVLDFKDLSPIASDKNLVIGQVFIESSDLIIKESDPVQVEFVIIGNLPTPCHQLRVRVSEPKADRQINIDAYTVTDPEMMCIQVLVPFQANIPLNDLANGKYNVFINGEQEASFELP